MNKHELKYKTIINTAFHEWGKTYFSKTSLSAIAEKLKMTKPAFYRYFSKKEKLEEAMEDHFLDGYKKNTFGMSVDKNLSFNGFLNAYLKGYFLFFGKNPDYIYFFSMIIRKDSFLKKKKFIQIMLKEKRFFKAAMKNSNMDLSEEDVNSIIGYCYCSVFFFLFMELNKKSGNKKNTVFSNEVIEKLTHLSYGIISGGFAGGKAEIIEFENIEKYSSLKDDEILERNKIFDAITSVVAKEGVWKSSMKKIAESAEMSKSGFYFYFKNRDEMLGNMFYDEIMRIFDLIKKRQVNYAGFYEKLYCNIAVETSYLLKDLRIVNFFDWIHFQKINMKYLNKNKRKFNQFLMSRFEFVKKAINEKLINDHTLDLELIVSFLNIQMVKEIIVRFMSGKELHLSDMRKIYNLFLYGTEFYS